MIRRQVFVLTLSTARLSALLEDAGFELRVPSDLAGGLLQIVSDPADDRLTLQRLTADQAGQLNAEELEGRRRVVEDVRPGQYL